jgi:hypothetical protein
MTQITRTRGDTVPDKFTVSNNATGEIVNLAACSFKMTVSTDPNPIDESTQVYQLDGVIADSSTGVVEFTPTAEQANQVGYFYYDIQMTDSYGRILTLVKDTYVYTQDITK